MKPFVSSLSPVVKTLFFVLTSILFLDKAQAQNVNACNTNLGIQSTSELKNNILNQAQLCAPADPDLTYVLGYLSAPTSGPDYAIVFQWGDGDVETVPITPADFVQNATGVFLLEKNIPHAYPQNDRNTCAYTARAYLTVDGSSCSTTLETVIVTSWATDNKNGEVRLHTNINGVQKSVVEVCEGVDIDVTFQDGTDFNCVGQDTQQDIAQSNTFARNRRIRYNTGAGAKIPNMKVGTTSVTDGAGIDLETNFAPDGVELLRALVYDNTTKAATARIQADGGFGAGFPKAGDEFEITLDYWNVCNKYDPAKTDAENTAAAVTATALIRIVGAPQKPTVDPPTDFCARLATNQYTLTPRSGQQSPKYKWYKNATLTDGLGTTFGTNPFNPITSLALNPSQDNQRTGTPLTQKLWVTVEPSINGAGKSCVSPPGEVTFTIQPLLSGGRIEDDRDRNFTSDRVCIGGSARLLETSSRLAVSGGDGNYTWQWQSATGNTFTDIQGAVAETYQPPDPTGYIRYRRKVISSASVTRGTACKQAFSNIYTLSVERLITPGTIGDDQVICEGGVAPKAIVQKTPSGGGIGRYLYKWKSTTVAPGTTGFTDIAGATSTNYTPPSTLTQTTWFVREDRGDQTQCTNTANTNVVKIEVRATVDPGTIKIGNTNGTVQENVCLGEPFPTLNQETAAGGGTYSWQKSTVKGGPYTTIFGATNPVSYTPTQGTATTFYVRSVSQNGCIFFSNEVEITTKSKPTIAISGGGARCGTLAASDVLFTAGGGDGPSWDLTYRFTSSAGIMNLRASSMSSNNTALANPSPGTYTIVELRDPAGCTAILPSDSSVLVTDAGAIGVPAVESVTSGTPVCDAGPNTKTPGAILDLSPDGQVPYTITYSLAGSSNIGTKAYKGSTDLNGIVTIPTTYADWNNTQDSISIRILSVRNDNTGCAITPNTDVYLKILPLPVVTAGQTNDVCNGEQLNHTVKLDTNLPSITNNTNLIINRVTPTPAALPNVQYTVQPHITETLSNITEAVTTVTYNVQPTANGCLGKAETITVNVHPTPAITPGQIYEACSGQKANVDVTLTKNPTNTRLAWNNLGNNAPITVFAANSPDIDDSYTVTGAATVKRTYSITPNINVVLPGGGNLVCSGAAEDVVINVLSVPSFGTNPDKSLCSGERSNYSVQLLNAPANTELSWDDPTTPGNERKILHTGNTTTHISDVLLSNSTTVPPSAKVYQYRVKAATGNSGKCSAPATTIEITAFPPPNTRTRTVNICETIDNALPDPRTGQGSIDLTTLEAGVTFSAQDVEVNWFENFDEKTMVYSSPIADAANYTVQQTDTVYAKVGYVASAGAANCFASAAVILNYISSPNDLAIRYRGSGTLLTKQQPNDPDTYSVCITTANEAARHTFDVSIPNTGSQYTWTIPAFANEVATSASSVELTLQAGANMDGDVSVVETDLGTGCKSPSQKVVITPASSGIQPSINGPAKVCTGVEADFSAQDAPSTANFTWDLPSYLSFATDARGANIRVKVLELPTGTTTQSNTIKLNVTTGPAACVSPPAQDFVVDIVQTPSMTSAGSVSICSGENVSDILTLTSEGGPAPITYEWTVQTITGLVGGTFTGDFDVNVSEIDIELENTSGADASVNYTVKPIGPGPLNIDGGNDCIGASQAVIVTVKPEPVIVPNQMKNVCSDEDFNYAIRLATPGRPIGTYFSWPDPDGTGSLLPGVQVLLNQASGFHITDQLPNVTENPFDITYIVNSSSPGSSPGAANRCAGKQENIVITVYPKPVGSNETIEVCSNSRLDYNLQDNIDAASGGVGVSTNFTWGVVADLPNVTGETIMASGGATRSKIDDLLINTSNVDQVVTYTVTPVTNDQQRCQGSTFEIRVTVHPEPKGVDADVSVCSGQALGYDLENNIVTQGNNLIVGTTYAWTTAINPNVTITASPNGTVINDTIQNITVASHIVDYTVTPSNETASSSIGGCAGNPFQIKVRVNPEPRGGSYSQQLCSSTLLDIDLQRDAIDRRGSRLSAVTFNWSAVVPTDISGLVAGPSVSPTIIATPENKSSNSHDVVYTVIPTGSAASGNCEGDAFDITITVYPEPVGKGDTKTICSKGDVNYDLQATNINTQNAVASGFVWKAASDNPSIQGESLVDRVSALMTNTLINRSNAAQVITYVVTPSSTANNCLGAEFNILVTVDPEPVGIDYPSESVCSGDALAYSLTDNINTRGNGLTTNTTYSWKAIDEPDVSGESTASNTTAIVTDVLTITKNTDQIVKYEITPTSAEGCVGEVFKLQVTVRPKPIGQDEAVSICSGEILNYRLEDNIERGNDYKVGAIYSWTTSVPNALVTGSATTLQNTSLIGDRLINTVATDQDIEYSYSAVGLNGCQGTSYAITVTVRPTPTLNANLASNEVCSSTETPNGIGVTLAVAANSVAAISYNVTAPPNVPGLTGTPTSGLGLQANALFNDSYENITTTPVMVTYSVTPVAIGVSACEGTPFDVGVMIKPKPVINPGLNTDVCSRLASGIRLSTNGGSVAANSYTLSGITIPPTITADPTNRLVPTVAGQLDFIEQDKYTNKTTADVPVTYQIQATSPAGCLSNSIDITLTVHPEPEVDVLGSSKTVCSGNTSTITLMSNTASVAAATYNLTAVNRASIALQLGLNNVPIGPNKLAGSLLDDSYINETNVSLQVVYKVIPVSADQCAGEEADVTLDVNPAPAIADNLDKTACSNDPSGSGITLTQMATSVASDRYDITAIDIAPDLTAVAGNAVLDVDLSANALENDRFDNPTDGALEVHYTVVGKSVTACESAPREIVLTVEPTLRVTPVIRVGNVCSGSALDIELNSPTQPTSGKITFDYTVTPSIPEITGFVPALSNLPFDHTIIDELVNSSDQGATAVYSITAVANGAKGGDGCSMLVPNDITVTIEPKPTLNASANFVTICEEIPTDIILNTTTRPSVGVVSFVVANTVPTGGMTPISGVEASYTNGETLAVAWDNPTKVNQIVTYTLTPTVVGGLGCVGDDATVLVTVRPDPEVDPVADITVCSGESLNIPFTIDLAGGFVSWMPTSPPSITGAASGGGNEINTILNNNSVIPADVIYRVTPKLNGCDGNAISVNVQVNPIPNLTSLPNDMKVTVCNNDLLNLPLSGDVPSTTFAWTVSDASNFGTPNQFDGAGTAINQQFGSNVLGYQINLIYEITPTSNEGCVGRVAFLNVEIPSIVPSIVPNATELCSGAFLQVTNASLGATRHKWFYREVGGTDELDIRTSPSVNYQLNNRSSLNPIRYEVVYEGSNDKCAVPAVVSPPISVYRSVTAGFDEGVIPPITAGISTVNFVDTSIPIDEIQFRYEWDFGPNSAPTRYLGANPPAVVYTGQGIRQVSLSVTNIDSEAIGLACSDRYSKTIVIPVLPLKAEFEVVLPQSCIPVTVGVNNTSSGDLNEWRVINDQGQVVFTSNESDPQFIINGSGRYSISLTTRDPFTGQVAVTDRTFNIYNTPRANFDARPSVIHVPETELIIDNLSLRANLYFWDFGDGETSEEEAPRHKYNLRGLYDLMLIAKSDYGNGVVCSDTLVKQIRAVDEGAVSVPNGFTPDPTFSSGTGGGGTGGGGIGGGGIGSGTGGFNDVFLPVVSGARSFNMQIYDRWGNLIFESTNAKIGWNGRNSNSVLMPAGVYVYRLEIVLSDGQRSTQVGDVTMIR